MTFIMGGKRIKLHMYLSLFNVYVNSTKIMSKCDECECSAYISTKECSKDACKCNQFLRIYKKKIASSLSTETKKKNTI